MTRHGRRPVGDHEQPWATGRPYLTRIEIMGTDMNYKPMRQARSQFTKGSFAVIRGFVGSAAVDQILGEIERYVADIVRTLSPEEVFYEVKGDPSILKQLPSYE